MGRPVAAGRQRRRGKAATVAVPPAAGDLSDEPRAEENAQQDAEDLDCMKGTEAGQTLDKLGLLLEDPTAFVTSADSVASAARAAAKAVFDHSAAVAAAEPGEDGAEETTGISALMLPELHVDGFDTEQIWLQVEMGLDDTLKRCRRLVKRATASSSGAQLLTAEAANSFGIPQGNDEATSDHDGSGSDGGMQAEGAEQDEGEEVGAAEVDSDAELYADDDDSDGGGDDEEEDEEDTSEGEEGEDFQEEPAAQSKKGQSAQGLKLGEDQFLNFDDMDKFLQDAEDQAARSSDDEEGEDDEEDDGEGRTGPTDGNGSDDSEAELMDALDREANKQQGRRRRAGEDEEEDEEEEDGTGLGGGINYEDFFGKKSHPEKSAPARAEADGARQQGGAGPSKARHLLGDGEGEEGDGGEEFLSAFEKQQRKMQRKIQALEEAAVGEKSWDMKGEVAASSRPLNSALEADLDFETGVKGAPEVSEEAAESIEEMIRKRCMEGNFDDVIRFAAPPPEKKKAVLELDNTKSSAGLGELYEKDYVRATAGGAVEDKDDPTRQEAKQLFGELCGKLDALSHFHFAPKPVVEELVIKADVPALAMEEALPTAASTANLKAPEETFKASSKRDLKADEELTPGEKKTARAKRKRASRLRDAEREAQKKSRAAAAGGMAETLGRKSEKEAQGVGSRKAARSEYVKSAGMFSKLQDQQNALKAGIKVPGKEEPKRAPASSFKL